MVVAAEVRKMLEKNKQIVVLKMRVAGMQWIYLGVLLCTSTLIDARTHNTNILECFFNCQKGRGQRSTVAKSLCSAKASMMWFFYLIEGRHWRTIWFWGKHLSGYEDSGSFKPSAQQSFVEYLVCIFFSNDKCFIHAISILLKFYWSISVNCLTILRFMINTHWFSF